MKRLAKRRARRELPMHENKSEGFSHTWDKLFPHVGKVKSTWVVVSQSLCCGLGRKGQTKLSKQKKIIGKLRLSTKIRAKMG